jgi:DNA relaxase NicK
VTTLSREIYRDVAHVRPVNGRPPTRSLILSGDGGSTVYIGARSSEQYGRVYDKGVQSRTREKGFWWRWEVEFKGELSYLYANQLLQVDDRPGLISSKVAHWFRTRCTHSYTASCIASCVQHSITKPSLERKLLWLSESVRPTVCLLADKVGRDRVLFALGLLPQSVVERERLPTTSEVA